MIVDDEPLAREVLRTIINENFNDISIVCEAVNGRQAVSLNMEHGPDIILMDMRIPGINGIEASKQIIEHSHDAVILVITAYDDFNFIQQALDLGVKGYMLKPVKDEDVVDKLNKCKKYIADNRSRGDINKIIENTENLVRPLIQKKIVSRLISGDFDRAEMSGYISFLQEKIEAGYFMLISFEQNLSNQINDSIRNEIHKERISEITARFLPFARKCFFGENIGNLQIVFFPFDKPVTEKEMIDEAMTIACDIGRKIKVMAGIDARIGIGRAYAGTENIHQSYNEAYYALRKAPGKGGILHYDKLKYDAPTLNYQYPFFLENELLEHVRRGNAAEAKKSADAIISDIAGNCSNIGLAKEYLIQLISILNRSLLLLNADSDLSDSMGIISELNKLTLLDELGAFCRNHIFFLIGQSMEARHMSKDSVVVSMVRSYIDKHFSKDINLEKIAGEVGLGASYISRIFKEGSGVNFIDYVIEKRINLAKKMLLDGEKSIKKISEAAGYSDVNYFCRVFKRSTGLTTGQFRLQNLKLTDLSDETTDRGQN